MFLIDDLIMAPVRGLHFIASSIHDAVEEERGREKQALRDELNELYMDLAAGHITDAEFDEREDVILDRLEELEAMEQRGDAAANTKLPDPPQ
jgi:hypothetical protein